MVGLSDIPCVGKFVDRISDSAVDAFFRGLHYMFCYKELVNVLNSEIEKVNIQEERVSAKSAQEGSDGKIINDHVLKWQTDVDEFQETAREFSEKYKNRASWTCLKCLPIPHPLSRFQLGKNAVIKAKKATELVDSGKELLANEIAHFPPTDNLPRNDASFQDFPSRKYAYGKLWEALINEGSSLILGIYGMPGVGKTRMMEQIWEEAVEKKIFNKVARADVGSEVVDVIKLQNQIAGHLNCHFESQDDVKGRASQLKNSLMNGGKILIILDDVWSEIPLEDIIGTSFGERSSSKGSKILLTSRRKDVCLQNNCKIPVQITTLTDSEAWDLFQNTVGTDRIDLLHDETLAKEVCTKCTGLPLLIRAVGKALQFMSHNVWKDALQKLEKGNFENIHGIDPQVYACVKLSIDRLSKDAKSCLFLCSLFPEDADIDITKLIHVAIGSEFIPDGESAVRAMVDVLVISSLLLKIDIYSHISYKLHDIIRDVASNIFFGDPVYGSSHVQCDSRLLRENAGFSTLKFLRLDVESDHVQFPVNLVCTELSTLWLHCNNHLQQFSGDFFNMFVNLRFLMLQNVHFCSEHFSLQPLSKLEMLIFDKCIMRETNVSLFPKNISTLCVWGSALPSPLDITNLEYLQKLDIQQEYGDEVIMVPNAISSLSSLEELHIPNGFRISDDAKDTRPVWDEICKLTRLTSLKIFLNIYETCEGTSKFLKLLGYEISAGDRAVKATRILTGSTKIIALGEIKVKSDGALQSLMERAEEVKLDSTEFDGSSIWNSDGEGFAELRALRIERCKVEYIAKISQDEIQHSREPRTSFSELTILKIWGCHAMKYLFCKSVATCLVQLQKLEVENCGAMEVIVMNEGISDGEIINFPKLKTLLLRKLWSLTSFYKSDMSCAQLRPLFDGKVAFPCLEYLKISGLEQTVDIWGERYYNDDNNNNVISASSFCKLKSLVVYCCIKLESIIPHAMLHRLRNLETLSTRECRSLRNTFQIIGGGDNDHAIIVFPALTKLDLYMGDESNTSFQVLKFPDLETLSLIGFGKINFEAIELGDDSTCRLKTLEVSCSDNQMQLPSKWQPHLCNLETLSLTHWWWRRDDLKSLRFPNLTELEVSNCGCSALFTISAFRSLQKLRRLKISGCDLLEEIVEDVSGEEHAAGMDAKTIIRLLELNRVVFKYLPKLKSFIHGANYECYMRALMWVEVDNCGLSSLFTISAFRSLQKLQTLKISGCDLLEVIVEDVSSEEHAAGMDAKTIIRLLELNMVVFKDLPKLKSFIHGANYECYMPALEWVEVHYCGLSSLFTISAFRSLQKLQTLKISGCDLLEVIVEDVSSEEHAAGMDAKTIIRLLELNRVVFKDLPKLKSFIHGANYECYMPALMWVEVDNCGLSSLFTISGFRNLQRLRTLEISKCSFLEEIVEDVSGEDNDHGIIVFPALTVLTLSHLENLSTTGCYHNTESTASFQVLKFPNLETFSLESCGKVNLEAIELGDDSTCRLRRLHVYSDNEMQLPSKWQPHLYNLENLSLTHCWWRRDDLKSLRFPNLTYLNVRNCVCSALFTISAFRSLQKLRTLEISACALLEEVVEDVSGEEHAAGMDAKTITLLELRIVKFKNLPKLKSFIHGANYECYMPALKEVEVDNCGLSSLFTCSVFRNLQQLDTLKVLNCQLLEDIVNNGRGDKISDTDEKVIIPSQLSVVTLKDLPKLKSFSRPIKCAFNMPKLKKIHLLGCPQLENFTYSRTITGLVSVYSDPEHEQEAVTDLNDFIIQNRKRSNLIQVLKNQELEMESGIVEEEQFQEGNRG